MASPGATALLAFEFFRRAYGVRALWGFAEAGWWQRRGGGRGGGQRTAPEYQRHGSAPGAVERC
eukprot:9030940-Prorocentrum_lima.AAC.1